MTLVFYTFQEYRKNALQCMLNLKLTVLQRNVFTNSNHLAYVRGHNDIPENEAADVLAKGCSGYCDDSFLQERIFNLATGLNLAPEISQKLCGGTMTRRRRIIKSHICLHGQDLLLRLLQTFLPTLQLLESLKAELFGQVLQTLHSLPAYVNPSR